MLDARMRNRLLTALLIASLSGSCTTLGVKHMEGVGYPFAGTREMPCNFATSLYLFPIGVLAWPFIIIDIPLSLTADLLFLPFDLAAERIPQRDRSCKST